MAVKKDKNTYSSNEPTLTAWSEDVLETIRALELATAQIEMSLRESDHAVENLNGAITGMAACIHRIEQQLGEPSQCADTAATRAPMLSECRESKDYMRQAVSAFQFYDLLSQRLMHIRDNLSALAEIVHAPDQQRPSMWRQLHEKRRSVYSLQQEQTMYQALLSGLSAEQFISQADVDRQGPCGDIELI